LAQPASSFAGPVGVLIFEMEVAEAAAEAGSQVKSSLRLAF